jgi:hypothetical protein
MARGGRGPSVADRLSGGPAAGAARTVLPAVLRASSRRPGRDRRLRHFVPAQPAAPKAIHPPSTGSVTPVT